MTNRERGEWRITVDGRPYVLRLTVAACLALEDEAGWSIDVAVAGVNRGSVQHLRSLYWAALQAAHADMAGSLDAVGDWLDTWPSLDDARHVFAGFMEHNTAEARAAGASEGGAPPWGRIYRDLRVMGLSSAAIDALSLRELWREYLVRRDQQHERITVAWWTAALQRAKSMPSLDRLTKETTARPAKQSWQAMKAYMQQFRHAS